jgi:hypothetical protein
MKYQPPYGVTDPNAPYVNGDPAAGIQGSIPPAAAIEYPQREIVNMITKGGFAPSDTDLYQLTRAARRALFAFGVDTGSANALSVALDPPLQSYNQGLEVRVLVSADNTGSSTIRINGLPTQQIVKKDGSQLFSGDLRANGIVVLVHDGANFQMVSGAAGSVTIGGTGWYNGADYVVDVGSANHIVGTPLIAPTAYAAGQSFLVLVKAQNTGPVDINLNALGVKPLKLPGNVDLAAGDIWPNMLIRVSYDGTAFKMLSPIYLERIDAATTFIVGPNAGADFADLNVAMTWLSRRRIDQNGGVTLSLQGSTSGNALIHNYNTSVVILHPDGLRLTIAGPAPAFIPSPGNFVCNGSSSSQISADAYTNLLMLRTAFRAELHFAVGMAFACLGTVGSITNFLVTGNTPTGGTGGGISINGLTNANCVASAYSPSACWQIQANATLSGQDIYACGAGVYAIGVAHAACLLVSGNNFIVAQSQGDGIQAAHGAIIQATTNNRTRIYGCVGNGINHWGASSVHIQSIYMNYLGQAGIVTSSANSWLPYAGINNCNQGYVCTMGASMDSSNGSTAGIASGDYVCSNGAFMYAAAYQNGAAQFSPSRNVIGNGNAYIEA